MHKSNQIKLSQFCVIENNSDLKIIDDRMQKKTPFPKILKLNINRQQLEWTQIGKSKVLFWLNGTIQTREKENFLHLFNSIDPFFLLNQISRNLFCRNKTCY